MQGIHFNLCLFILSAVSSVHTSFITSTITSTLRAYQQEFQLLAEELSPGPSTGPSSEPSTKPSSGPFLDHSFEPSFVPSAEHSVQRSYSSFSIAPPPTASRFSIQQIVIGLTIDEFLTIEVETAFIKALSIALEQPGDIIHISDVSLFNSSVIVDSTIAYPLGVDISEGNISAALVSTNTTGFTSLLQHELFITLATSPLLRKVSGVSVVLADVSESEPVGTPSPVTPSSTGFSLAIIVIASISLGVCVFLIPIALKLTTTIDSSDSFQLAETRRSRPPPGESSFLEKLGCGVLVRLGFIEAFQVAIFPLSVFQIVYKIKYYPPTDDDSTEVERCTNTVFFAAITFGFASLALVFLKLTGILCSKKYGAFICLSLSLVVSTSTLVLLAFIPCIYCQFDCEIDKNWAIVLLQLFTSALDVILAVLFLLLSKWLRYLALDNENLMGKVIAFVYKLYLTEEFDEAYSNMQFYVQSCLKSCWHGHEEKEVGLRV